MNLMTSRLVIALLMGLLLSSCQLWSPAKNQPKYQEFVSPGEVLPITEIKDIEGNVISLSDPSEKKLIVLFATWCSDSNRALKALNQSPLLHDSNIEIVAIAREESIEVVKKWRDKNDIKIPLAVDPDRSIFKQFAAAGIPRLITVTNDNKIIKMNLAEGVNQLQLIQWNE